MTTIGNLLKELKEQYKIALEDKIQNNRQSKLHKINELYRQKVILPLTNQLSQNPGSEQENQQINEFLKKYPSIESRINDVFDLAHLTLGSDIISAASPNSLDADQKKYLLEHCQNLKTELAQLQHMLTFLFLPPNAPIEGLPANINTLSQVEQKKIYDDFLQKMQSSPDCKAVLDKLDPLWQRTITYIDTHLLPALSSAVALSANELHDVAIDSPSYAFYRYSSPSIANRPFLFANGREVTISQHHNFSFSAGSNQNRGHSNTSSCCDTPQWDPNRVEPEDNWDNNCPANGCIAGCMNGCVNCLPYLFYSRHHHWGHHHESLSLSNNYSMSQGSTICLALTGIVCGGVILGLDLAYSNSSSNSSSGYRPTGMNKFIAEAANTTLNATQPLTNTTATALATEQAHKIYLVSTSAKIGVTISYVLATGPRAVNALLSPAINIYNGYKVKRSVARLSSSVVLGTATALSAYYAEEGGPHSAAMMATGGIILGDFLAKKAAQITARKNVNNISNPEKWIPSSRTLTYFKSKNISPKELIYFLIELKKIKDHADILQNKKWGGLGYALTFFGYNKCSDALRHDDIAQINTIIKKIHARDYNAVIEILNQWTPSTGEKLSFSSEMAGERYRVR